MRLTQLHAATRIEDLRLPPSNQLEALKGGRKGQWSIRVNKQWRNVLPIQFIQCLQPIANRFVAAR